MKELWQLFYAFVRIGALTFGGGYSMLPMIEREVVEKHRWATEEEVMDYFAVSQCTPGVIAVNTATFVGYKQKGVLGGVVATLGVILPSLCIILVIASVLENFAQIPIVQHAFAGINVAVAALIVQAVVKLARGSVVDWLCVGVMAASFGIMALLGPSPLVVVVAAALTGVLGRRFLKLAPFVLWAAGWRRFLSCIKWPTAIPGSTGRC